MKLTSLLQQVSGIFDCEDEKMKGGGGGVEMPKDKWRVSIKVQEIESLGLIPGIGITGKIIY